MQFYRKMCGELCCFLENVFIVVYTNYIHKINYFCLVVCSPAYCLKAIGWGIMLICDIGYFSVQADTNLA